jgi:hypothetical protein
MTVEFKKRDYSLTIPENARAVAVGLANKDWYKTDIPRERIFTVQAATAAGTNAATAPLSRHSRIMTRSINSPASS